MIERELKLDIDDNFVLPDFNNVIPGLSAQDLGDRQLAATYWDEANLELAHAHIGCRHRTDSADGSSIWTLKMPSSSGTHPGLLVRPEHQFEGDKSHPPQALLAELATTVGDVQLRPTIDLACVRHVVELVVSGEQVAEVVHDRVTVTQDGKSVGSFAEVEVELWGSDDQVLQPVVARLQNAGARVGDSTSKYIRALQLAELWK
jgi:inorganic triphosphatase YgiF